jgi:hypothetical protein
MMHMSFKLDFKRYFCVLTGAALAIVAGRPAAATDEIQVYNAGIAAPGQLTIQQHLNYVSLGIKQAPFQGGLISNNSINGTPEFAYGMTDWWELGLYLPFAIKDQQFLSDSFKLRTLFVVPHADQQNLFYGVNFEFSNTTPRFSQARFGLEIRPIIGIRNTDYEFIVNPIVDVGFGKYGEADFAPALRVARNLGHDLFVGLDKLPDQQHTLFAVTDFKAGVFDIDFGLGYGLTPGSDRWVVKTIIGYAFPVAGSNSSSSEHGSAGPVNPMSRSAQRQLQP